MKTLIITLLVLCSTTLLRAEWVRGYMRSDGTWVQGYYRTTRDNNPYNNLSSPKPKQFKNDPFFKNIKPTPDPFSWD